jgi:hypothetical protein
MSNSPSTKKLSPAKLDTTEIDVPVLNITPPKDTSMLKSSSEKNISDLRDILNNNKDIVNSPILKSSQNNSVLDLKLKHTTSNSLSASSSGKHLHGSSSGYMDMLNSEMREKQRVIDRLIDTNNNQSEVCY